MGLYHGLISGTSMDAIVEAVALAWFARRTSSGLPSNAGSVTGAKGGRILGGVYRYA